MYELERVGENTYLIQCPAMIGLYVKHDVATLIDSGGDKEAGRKILQHINANNWKLGAIVNTHSHADHIGGNAFLQARTGCAIYAGGAEGAFVRHPLLEPSFLYGGRPPKALHNKFLLAQPSDPIAGQELPKGLISVPLKGHSFDMTGVRTDDDVLFLADCLMGLHILEKYHISFIYDVEQYLCTLDAVEQMQAALFVPSHASPVRDIRPLVQGNRDKVREMIALLLSLCRTPRTAEEVLTLVMDHYGLTLDFNQYVLCGSTLRSYLAYLLDGGRLQTSIESNRLLWQTV